MDVFDFNNSLEFPYAEREKNVLIAKSGFKVRVIELPPGGEMPLRNMATNVIFYVVNGTAHVTVGDEKETIGEGQCLITELATLSMKTDNGVKIMAI